MRKTWTLSLGLTLGLCGLHARADEPAPAPRDSQPPVMIPGRVRLTAATSSSALPVAMISSPTMPAVTELPGAPAVLAPTPVPVTASTAACGAQTCQAPCCPDASCESTSGLYGSAEYLLWWIKDSNLPPLVTRGNFGDFTPGALGQPHTTVLFGGEIENEERSGGRFTLGYWLDDEQSLGAEGTFFFLGRRAVRFSASGNGEPNSAAISRPFLNVNSGMQDAFPIVVPGILSGTVAASLSSQFWGLEANARARVVSDGVAFDLLAGFRFLDLQETLNIGQVSSELAPGTTTFAFYDRFGTENRFYGGQVGAEAGTSHGPWFINARAKVALGGTEQVVEINGNTRVSGPSGATLASGPRGLLAEPSNSGHHEGGDFSVVPEVGVRVGYRFSDALTASAGYTFLYWSSVVRPGDQIDTGLNIQPLNAPQFGPARPAFSFHDTDFWAQGIDLGLEFHF